VFVAIEMRAEVYGNQSPDSQSSNAFFLALNKAINTRKYSQPYVDSFLTVQSSINDALDATPPIPRTPHTTTPHGHVIIPRE